MGLSYYQNLTTWHNGTSSLGSTTYQDDMSVISATNNGFGGYRSDDYGNTIASATPLSGTTTLTRSGIITRTSDVDVFSFQTGAGSVNFTINPAQYGPNLDILAQLLDSSGTVIASSNSSSNLFANLNASVSAGTYFVSVKSNGQYGRVGQYSISGTVPSGDTTPPTANSFTPADNATEVAVGANLVANFSEAIQKGSGNLVIQKLSDNSVVETIAVTAANVTVSGSQLTINPTANLLQGTDYYVGIANGAIKDIAGNNYAGITGNSTWNFKTQGFPPINGTANNDILTGTANPETINGLGGNDQLLGDGGNDSLNGGAGIDTLDGGAGNDILKGNTGNDIYIVGTGDIVTELANQGTDLVQSAISYTLPANVENLTLTGTTAINGTGNTLANIITGNTANNTLNGGDGNDSLRGGAANDALTGGLGADKFIYNTNAVFTTSAVGVDTITDFNISETDQIVLDKTTFTSISSAAGTGFSVASEFAQVTTDALAATSAADIVYNSTTGGLFYNQNGTAAGLGTGAKFLTLTTKPVLTATQFLIQA
ncbi:MAG: Ig-like domain-containing protein [Planktothrix sp. GU0601_MAG3]|nr:MAG: Ig-like domain-containing protein [Planktothrix sp. GU0601_MAG3]